MFKSLTQGLAIFFGAQLLIGQFNKFVTKTTSGEGSSAAVNTPTSGEIPPFHARPDTLDEGATYNPVPQRIAPMWPSDNPIDITIVISPTFARETLSKVPKDRVVLEEKAFLIDNPKESRVVDTTIKVPKAVQNNGTLWGHFYIGLSGEALDPSEKGFDPARAYHFVHPLTQYIAKKKVKKTKNLLAAKETVEEVESPQFCLRRSTDRI